MIKEYIKVQLSELIPNSRNPRKNDGAVDAVSKSIKETGYITPIVIDENNQILCGHTRAKSLKKLGHTELEVLKVTGLTDEQKKRYAILDNKTGEVAEWDFEILQEDFKIDELVDLGFDIKDLDQGEVVEDEAPPVPETPKTVKGDVYEMNGHRVMCGDSTIITDVEKLMANKKADLSHNDPPYGMKKENAGVLNDNLNYDDLLQFNRDWIDIQFSYLKENGSFYCWGTDEPLMDIYSNILKPYIKTQKATFRNFITWNKGPSASPTGSPMGSSLMRRYPPGTEKCLFVMCGVQGFNNNASNYFDGWEVIRSYLESEAIKVGLTSEQLKEITGVGMYSHWFTKSQWTLIPEEHYKNLQNEFKNAFKKQYEELKKEYEELKKEYYSTRAYFDNTHAMMWDVWDFRKTGGEEKIQTGGHATPKPIALCERVVKSSCPEHGLVIDFFLGSGSTLMACEQTNRKCYGMELHEKYVDVCVQRWVNFTKQTKIKRNGIEIEWPISENIQ